MKQLLDGMAQYRVTVLLLKPLAWLAFRPQVRGREHLPRGGFVISANHLSGWDAIAIAYALAPRPVWNMGKNQLFRRPLLGPLIRAFGAFPAREEESFSGGVAAAVELARSGQVVSIYPEGARRRGDRSHRPRTGAARTALEAGVPLVPARLEGTDGWRERRRWRITIGAPIELADLRALDPVDGAREATARLWSAIEAL